MKTDLANRMRAIILGFILLVLAVLTLWVFVMVAGNLSLIPSGIGKRYDSNWWIPILPQMNIATLV
jgi:general stress protein CsbA